MTYEYVRRLITDEVVSGGLALYDLKQVLVPWSAEFWMNFTAFNLYGDPALGLFSITGDTPPLQSQLDGVWGRAGSLHYSRDR